MYLAPRICLIIGGVVALLSGGGAFAHDPVFSPGPHVLFKGGVELHSKVLASEQGDKTVQVETIATKYGLTGDWVAGIELPYRSVRNGAGSSGGVGDVVLSTKYRFWRKDSLGKQESAAVLLNVKLDTANSTTGTGTTDALLGFAYGYESLKWYRWTSVRYRFNQDNNGLRRGDRWFVDFAGGYRHRVNDYRDPDTVWLLELNGEFGQYNALNGRDLANSGGSQWFVSPGVMWTKRNFAVKAGVQIPVYSSLNGDQADADYRALLELELHL